MIPREREPPVTLRNGWAQCSLPSLLILPTASGEPRLDLRRLRDRRGVRVRHGVPPPSLLLRRRRPNELPASSTPPGPLANIQRTRTPPPPTRHRLVSLLVRVQRVCHKRRRRPRSLVSILLILIINIHPRQPQLADRPPPTPPNGACEVDRTGPHRDGVFVIVLIRLVLAWVQVRHGPTGRHRVEIWRVGVASCGRRPGGGVGVARRFVWRGVRWALAVDRRAAEEVGGLGSFVDGGGSGGRATSGGDAAREEDAAAGARGWRRGRRS